LPDKELSLTTGKPVPERIREARIGMGLSQAQLARALGVDPMTISRLERGKARLPTAMLLAMAGLFGLQPAELDPNFEGIPYDPAPASMRPIQTLTGLRVRASVSEPLTSAAPEFSRVIREREKEVELELIRMGANDVEVRGFSQSIRGNPLLVAAFSGGAPTKLSNEQIVQLFDGAASGYKAIVRMLVAEREAEGRREARRR
jgi:transcriptional regulator with XRE-family HTH domain